MINYNSLKVKIIYMTICPIAIVSLLVSMIAYFRINSLIHNETRSELIDICEMINDDSSIDSNDLSVVSISLINDEGVRVDTNNPTLKNSYINDNVFIALENSNETYVDNTAINGTRYAAYYKNKNNFTIEVLKPLDSNLKLLSQYGYPIFIVSGLILLLSVILIIKFANSLCSSILELEDFVSDISNEEFDSRISHAVYYRDDEIGSIAKGVVAMRDCLKDNIEIDPLTSIYNRKTGEKKLLMVKEKCYYYGKNYCLAIGDIDFFKKVNDTYGHKAGDKVLIEIAKLIKDEIGEHGIVSRWGGEEFLIIFNTGDIKKAKKRLENTLNKIRNLTVSYGKYSICVTMSFGIICCNAEDKDSKLFKRADELLYYAKEHGRNQIKSEE